MPSIRSGKLWQETYKCEKCGTSRTINRSAKKKMGHPKHMLCPGCDGKKTKFIKIE